MGIVDMFKADAVVELRVSELYEFMKTAADNGAKARYLMNGVNCEVPYKYIREVITGEPEIKSIYKPPIMDGIAVSGVMEEESYGSAPAGEQEDE